MKYVAANHNGRDHVTSLHQTLVAEYLTHCSSDWGIKAKRRSVGRIKTTEYPAATSLASSRLPRVTFITRKNGRLKGNPKSERSSSRTSPKNGRQSCQRRDASVPVLEEPPTTSASATSASTTSASIDSSGPKSQYKSEPPLDFWLKENDQCKKFPLPANNTNTIVLDPPLPTLIDLPTIFRLFFPAEGTLNDTRERQDETVILACDGIRRRQRHSDNTEGYPSQNIWGSVVHLPFLKSWKIMQRALNSSPRSQNIIISNTGAHYRLAISLNGQIYAKLGSALFFYLILSGLINFMNVPKSWNGIKRFRWSDIEDCFRISPKIGYFLRTMIWSKRKRNEYVSKSRIITYPQEPCFEECNMCTQKDPGIRSIGYLAVAHTKNLEHPTHRV